MSKFGELLKQNVNEDYKVKSVEWNIWDSSDTKHEHSGRKRLLRDVVNFYWNDYMSNSFVDVPELNLKSLFVKRAKVDIGTVMVMNDGNVEFNPNTYQLELHMVESSKYRIIVGWDEQDGWHCSAKLSPLLSKHMMINRVVSRVLNKRFPKTGVKDFSNINNSQSSKVRSLVFETLLNVITHYLKDEYSIL